ncbi:hypothetical protein BGW38_010339, partial [Lunasporangiospora selenospora]
MPMPVPANVPAFAPTPMPAHVPVPAFVPANIPTQAPAFIPAQVPVPASTVGPIRPRVTRRCHRGHPYPLSHVLRATARARRHDLRRSQAVRSAAQPPVAVLPACGRGHPS